MDKKDFINLIENIDIDVINNFKLEIELNDGTEIVLKNIDNN